MPVALADRWMQIGQLLHWLNSAHHFLSREMHLYPFSVPIFAQLVELQLSPKFSGFLNCGWNQLIGSKISRGSVDRNGGTAEAGEQTDVGGLCDWISCIFFGNKTKTIVWIQATGRFPTLHLSHQTTPTGATLFTEYITHITGYCSWASRSKREQGSRLFCSLGWAPHTWPRWGVNPSFSLNIWLVRRLLSLCPLRFPTEEEEQRWNSNNSTFPYHKGPSRVGRERTHSLPTFPAVEDSLSAYFHF